MTSSDTCLYEAGDVSLEHGGTLRKARLAYQQFGQLDADAGNAVLITSHFARNHTHCGHLFGPGQAVDPARHCIIVVNFFGNGCSTSPSTGYDGEFPTVTVSDNVRVQHRLIREHLGIKRLALVTGHSMGAVAAYHWAVMFPDAVARLAPICGSARTSDHNKVFLQGMRAILLMDPAWRSEAGWSAPRDGLAAMARAWAAWPPSAHFYRGRFWQRLGCDSLEQFLQQYWEDTYCSLDARDLLAQMDTWEAADIGSCRSYGGDLASALAGIRAHCFVMPSLSDAYFPPEDGENEAAAIPFAEYRPIPSHWGHWAGSGQNPADTAFIDAQLRQLLEIPAS